VDGRDLTSQIFVTLAGAIARYDSDLDDDAYNDAPYIDEDDDTAADQLSTYDSQTRSHLTAAEAKANSPHRRG
jgi:hypothetical protein